MNDKVTRNLFDGQQFILKFSNTGNIVDQIKANKGKVLLAKFDIARASRNFCVDPADAFKFNIKWQNKYYLDVWAIFDWVQGGGGGGGGATFQLASDAVSDAMSHQRRRVFAYKDDYLLVSRADLAYSQFQDLSDLITDLGLPMNPDKKIPPTRRLTCLGVSTELGSTHIA